DYYCAIWPINTWVF
nr:immunoglobulin light chain junction region [Macaca mulatta]MOW66193.1 immunoglobulin light chain junction region [Macaca mulatta]MOW66211.1 immunoglobulin light chain junction region [Macaca mulatta]MOW66369.1 immunoglobulin light chain junction region [Macaca mulatta]MOW66392.1 immunoglobulin light chain junction region [Macaca mulatta]